MKRTVSILIVCLLLLTLPACGHRIKHLVYTEDYPTVYQNELKAIFGDYTIGPRIEQHVDGEHCSCGYHRNTLDYYEWKITYRDACGQTMTCTMDNIDSLYKQQYDWLEKQVGAHFYTGCMARYYGDRMTEGGSYCFCFLGDFCNSWSNEAEKAEMDAGKAYRKTLETTEKTVPLASLTYPEIFDRYPISLSISVRLNDADLAGDALTENFSDACAKLDALTAEMQQEIGSELNLYASTWSTAKDDCLNGGDYRLYYVRGERVEMGSNKMDHAIFKSYIGKFW